VLGRAGSVDKIRKAVRLLKENGVENLNADLIYAIPGQTIEAWKEELIQAVDLGIKHLSAYSLTIEEGTALAQKKLAVPDDELAAEMWQVTGELLSKSNLYRYEISNYASPGNECIHNNCVWHGEPYLGCGPAAASFDGSARWCNCSDLDSWLLGQEAEQDELSAEGRAREIFVIGLRTVQGWNWQEFKDLTGFDFYSFNLPDDKRMFSVDTENNYRLTESGLLFWDTIAENII
jgi:oxygen-independent coproporphyrinogen-3 oxidase